MFTNSCVLAFISVSFFVNSIILGVMSRSVICDCGISLLNQLIIFYFCRPVNLLRFLDM